MKNEKLMRAIGEIDEDLIAEAHEETRAKLIWVRFAACAACVALVVLAVPNVLNMMGAGAAAEMDQIEAPQENMEALSPDIEDMMPEHVGLEPTDQIYPGVDASSSSKEEIEYDSAEKDSPVKIQAALDEQGGVAYPLDVSVEKKYGKVMFTNRTKSTITMKISLLRNYPVNVYSASSGIWCLTVNGEEATEFPAKAGTYEVVIDISDDNPPSIVFVEGFGVFSWDYETYE